MIWYRTIKTVARRQNYGNSPTIKTIWRRNLTTLFMKKREFLPNFGFSVTFCWFFTQKKKNWFEGGTGQVFPLSYPWQHLSTHIKDFEGRFCHFSSFLNCRIQTSWWKCRFWEKCQFCQKPNHYFQQILPQNPLHHGRHPQSMCLESPFRLTRLHSLLSAFSIV